MHRLFWGLLFVLLDWPVTVGRATVEILPDFLGFYLLMRAMERMADRSVRFNRGRHWAFGLSLLSGILFTADLLDPEAMARVWLWALALAQLVVTLVLLGVIRRGLSEMGRDTERLKAMEGILWAVLPICHLVSWVPLVGSVCRVAALVTAGLYLAVFAVTVMKKRS